MRQGSLNMVQPFLERKGNKKVYDLYKKAISKTVICDTAKFLRISSFELSQIHFSSLYLLD